MFIVCLMGFERGAGGLVKSAANCENNHPHPVPKRINAMNRQAIFLSILLVSLITVLSATVQPQSLPLEEARIGRRH